MQRLSGLLEQRDFEVVLGVHLLGVDSVYQAMNTSTDDGRVAFSRRLRGRIRRIQDIGYCVDVSLRHKKAFCELDILSVKLGFFFARVR